MSRFLMNTNGYVSIRFRLPKLLSIWNTSALPVIKFAIASDSQVGFIQFRKVWSRLDSLRPIA
jgi:hypothetical protein